MEQFKDEAIKAFTNYEVFYPIGEILNTAKIVQEKFNISYSSYFLGLSSLLEDQEITLRDMWFDTDGGLIIPTACIVLYHKYGMSSYNLLFMFFCDYCCEVIDNISNEDVEDFIVRYYDGEEINETEVAFLRKYYLEINEIIKTLKDE